MMQERFNTAAKRARHTLHMWRTKGAAKMSLVIWGRWILTGKG